MSPAPHWSPFGPDQKPAEEAGRRNVSHLAASAASAFDAGLRCGIDWRCDGSGASADSLQASARLTRVSGRELAEPVNSPVTDRAAVTEYGHLKLQLCKTRNAGLRGRHIVGQHPRRSPNLAPAAGGGV